MAAPPSGLHFTQEDAGKAWQEEEQYLNLQSKTLSVPWTPLPTPADCCFCYTGQNVVIDPPEAASHFVFGPIAVNNKINVP